MEKKLQDEIIAELRGRKIDIYTDYRDFEYLQDAVVQYDTKEEFVDSIIEAYDDSLCYETEELRKEMAEKFNISKDSDEYDELLDLIQENVEVNYPVKEFLSKKLKVNILTNHYNDINTDFTSNGWLRWLMHTQGYKLKDYPKLNAYAAYRFLVPCKVGPFYEDPVKTDWSESENQKYENNRFINTLLTEITEMPIDYMRTLAFLVTVTVEDYYNLKEGNFKKIKIPKDTMCGLYNLWNGSGSMLGICLEKDLIISKNNLYLAQLEVNRRSNKFSYYTINEVYGLTGSCWENNASIR